MAETAVQIAIQLLTPLITAEIILISGLPDDVRAIKDELVSISAFLKSAEERVVRDDETKAWLRQVRTLAYDIEDVIEEYELFYKESAYGKAKNYLLLRVRRMANTIKQICQRAVEIGRARESYRFNNRTGRSQDPQTTPSFTVCIPTEFELVGAATPKREVMELLGLQEHNKRPSTVAVVGMRGLGKTAIVRSIYNDTTVRGSFPVRVWLSAPRKHRLLDILKSIMKQFYEAHNGSIQQLERVTRVSHFPTYALDRFDSMDRRSLQDLIRNSLKEERYMVVFDDVQDGDIELATYFKSLLPTNDKDSKILVTTRYQNVAHAWLDGSCHGEYRMRSLPLEKAWELFCKKTFRSHGVQTCPPWLNNLARGIVEKCEGLPPAILAVGSLLSTKLNDSLEWQKVYDSPGFYLEKNSHLTGFYEILVRNYYDLPYYLKPCFLYFGLFPKEHPVDRMRLIRLWIAEGFIAKDRGKLTLEEVAEENLNELISMNLVEVAYKDPTERPKTLRVHEFLHEIILSKLDELSFCQVLSANYCTVDESLKPRRLSIHKDHKSDACEILKSITKCKSNLRCLVVFEPAQDISSKVLTTSFLKSVHLLKVLDLCNAPINEIPWEVGKLSNLRFLSLRNTRVSRLPSSIGKLQDLQTLDLKQTPIPELPTEINMLHKLRHLLTYSYEFDCGFSSHTQIVRGIKLPKGALGNFGELQKLAFVKMGYKTRVTRELRKLRQLTRLGIIELKMEDGRDLCAAVEDMKYLQAFNVYSKHKSEMIDLEHFQSPPSTLKRLYLNGPLRSFPRWIFELHSLVKIRLRWSSIPNWEPLDKLHALPNLVELHLLEAYNGEFIEFATEGFKKLKILHLLDLHRLECLLINEGALLCLEELSIGLSLELQMPSGIQYLSSLKTLNFINMPRRFTDDIQRGKQYYSVVQHVPCVFLQHFNYVRGIWEANRLQ